MKMNKKNKNGKKFLDKIIDMFFESISYEEYDIEPIYQEEDKFYKKIINLFYAKIGNKNYRKIAKSKNLTDNELEMLIINDNIEIEKQYKDKLNLRKKKLFIFLSFIIFNFIITIAGTYDIGTRIKSFKDVLVVFNYFYCLIVCFLGMFVISNVFLSIKTRKFYKITNYKDVKFNIKSLFVSLLFIIPFPILSIYFGTKLHVIIGIVFVLMLVVTMFLYSIITVNMFDKLNDDVEGLV